MNRLRHGLELLDNESAFAPPRHRVRFDWCGLFVITAVFVVAIWSKAP